MSFVVIMPTHFEWNVSQVLANLSWDILHQPLLREKPTKVRLPKLHLNYQLDLVATLSRLGKEAGHRQSGGRKPPPPPAAASRSKSEQPFLGLREVKGLHGTPWTPCPEVGWGGPGRGPVPSKTECCKQSPRGAWVACGPCWLSHKGHCAHHVQRLSQMEWADKESGIYDSA